MREQGFLKMLTVFPSLGMDADTSTTFLQALIENSPIALIVLDAQHRFTMCNPAFEKLFQYSPNELATSNLDELIAGPEMVEEAAQFSRQVLRGIKVHKITQRRRRDGMMVDVELYGIPLMVEGQLAGVYGLYQDVTERNKAQTAFRQISDRMDNLQQEERRRIARDLHDSTSQELAVLNWNLARLRNLVSDGDETLKLLVQSTIDIASQCSARIRSASYLLHPPLLGQAGLTVALSWLVEGFEGRSGIQVTLDIDANLGRFRDEVEIAVFRVVQESLANVLRHSGSPTVTIALHRQENWLKLNICDKGNGEMRDLFVTHDRQSGLGISGMRERVEQLDGCLEVGCSSGGTIVQAMIPLEMSFNV